ncbi:MAG: spore cortex biosynthesis protein YabQ [Firmicutes bacterium]|nr:spore cortex biosynthesis protein YabQ [Bacillota bacterium]
MKEWILGLDQLSPQVRQQLLDIIVMTSGGMTVGLMRTVDRLIKRRLNRSPVAKWILEVLFWILAGICAADFLYYCAYGALSFHSIFSLWMGFFAWKKWFDREIVSFVEAVFCRQDLTQWGIIKRSVTMGERSGEHRYGKDETKPSVQKRKRKQRHRHR